MIESGTPASGDAAASAEAETETPSAHSSAGDSTRFRPGGTEAKPPSGLAALPLPGALAGEFFGTFILVFFGVGAVNAAVVTGAQAGLWQVAVVWAVGVSLGIYTAAALSGAHINPAITAAAAVWDGFPWRRVVPYWVAQTLGAAAASIVLYGMFFEAIIEFERQHGLLRGGPGGAS